VVGEVAVLTRSSSPTATIELINVPHRTEIKSTDMRYEVTGRALKRGAWVQLNLSGCHPGDQLVVHWRYGSRGRTRYTTLPVIVDKPE
jgi:hypothetical protein